jgi:hypothetical protein
MTAKRFNLRSFVALMITFAGLGLPVTGYANHLYALGAPSVARHAWMAAHNALGIGFALFALWHVILNRRTLAAHLRRAGARLLPASREALVAGAIVALSLFLVVGHALHGGRR